MKEKMILDATDAWKYGVELNNFRREQDRRDRFAAAALTGLLAKEGDWGIEVVSKKAIQYGDALIAALEET
jgi:hypothetical protein